VKNYKPYQLVLILLPFVFSFALGLDIYIPVIPQMAQIFDTSPSMIHLTLSLFLFVTGAGQLFLGPLSDQFGRKNIFYFSSICYAAGAGWSVFCPHIFWLILARILTSVGACGMLVTSFALVRDLYSEEESGKMFSYLNGAIGISPTFAPIIGGHLAVCAGWQSIFVFLVLIGIISIGITKYFIKETLPPDKRVKINGSVFKRYLTIVQNRQFLTYSLISGCGESVFFCFFSLSPFIIINLHGVPTEQFGYYFSVFGAVIGLGGFAAGKVIEKLGINTTLAIGMMFMFIGGLSMLGWYMVAVTLQGFLIPMAVACTGAMFVIGGCAAKALEPFGRIAGTAAAAFGAIEFGLSALVGSLLMLFSTESTVPYGVFIVILACCAFLLFRRDMFLKKI